MTPAARLQASIEILDQILSGQPAEQVLTTWARTHRFAGSGDRAAIRDHVYDCLRCRRSFAHLGGSETGRGLVLGLLRDAGTPPESVCDGARHGPAPLTQEEAAFTPGPMPESVALDCPDWLADDLRAALGADFAPVMAAMRQRAPVFLRANPVRTDPAGGQEGARGEALAALAADGIDARPHPLAPFAIEVIGTPRALRTARACLDGLVEFQDAASQAVIHALPDPRGLRVLDYCAGGGGKALALAALGADVTAHDAAPARMKDIPARAARAGVSIQIVDRITDHPGAQYDMVLTDVPCSGSGSWRRAPAGKWALTPEGLGDLLKVQARILDRAARHLRPGGWLAYVTCSMLEAENTGQIAAFLARNPAMVVQKSLRLTPLDGGDGFFLCVMQRGAQG